MRFTQCAHLGGPVVHLNIDVRRILAVPHRGKLLAPDALQIQCGRIFPTAGQHQIPAKGKIQGCETRVTLSLSDFCNSPVCGKLTPVFQRKHAALHARLEILQMPLQKCIKPQFPGRLHLFHGPGSRFLLPVVRGCGEINADTGRPVCIQLGICILCTSVCVHAQCEAKHGSACIAAGRQGPFIHRMIEIQEHASPSAGPDHFAGTPRVRDHAFKDITAVIPDVQLKGSGAVCPVADAQNLVRMGNEALACHLHIVFPPCHPVHTLHQVQFLPVVFCAFAVWRPARRKR